MLKAPDEPSIVHRRDAGREGRLLVRQSASRSRTSGQELVAMTPAAPALT